MSGDALLATHDVVKRFGGVIALKGVSFDLRPGEIHALCGENGAGKSTLINLLGGVYPHGSYSGDIFVGGKPAHFGTPRDAEHAGIAVIHQELALFADMSVAENLLLGRLPRRLGVVNWDEVHARAREILGACGVDLDPETLVGDLGVASRQLVEIARAVAKSPKVLVLDEPTAALASQEIERLLALVRDLRGRGVACIYISHKLDEVFSIADRITVLRDGESIGTLSAAQTNPAEVIRLMVGRTIEDLYPRRSSTPGRPLLEIEALNVAERPSVPPFLRDLSLAVHAGEVLGIGGLMGAGRSELLMHLFGVWGHRVTGRVLLNGAPMPTPTPAGALQSGLALVTEDRKRFGLVMEHGVTFNLSLSSLQRLVRHLLLQQDAEIARARTFVKGLNIKTHRLDSPVQTLSGGNQQKVVIGRSLMTEPSVLLLDEPTRGIDVGAKLEVYELINRLTDEGKGIVLVSSELSELLGLSDRIVMLCQGRIGGEFSRSEATQEKLLAAAMGRTVEAA
jgi:D-xylose transport system ATP-binding protein